MSDIIVFIISFLILYQSSKWVVNSAIRVSDIFNLSRLAVGFIFLAVCTSLPELFVAIISGITNNVPMAIGNIIGANVYNATLALAVVLLIGGTLYLTSKQAKDIMGWLLLASEILILIFVMGPLTIIHGIALIVVFIIFSVYTFESRPVHLHTESGILDKVFIILEFLGGVVLLIIASNFLVTSASNIALAFEISTTVIGATIVSLGTTLPEITVAVQAILKKEYEMVIGDLVGSIITNSTLVLGFAALFGAISLSKITVALPIILTSFILITYWLKKNKKLSMKNGFLFLALYFIFIAVELLLI